MDRPVVTTGFVSAGKLKVRHGERVTAELQRWRDTECVITIERKRATRSKQANNYYWHALGLLSEHTGYHVDELHQYFRQRFLGRTVVLTNADGEIIGEDTVGQSTAKQNTLTFYEYVERIREVAAEMGVVIPDPDPNWCDELHANE